MSQTINIKQVVEYWKNSAQRDYSIAKYLYEGRRYSNCLFFLSFDDRKNSKRIGCRTH